MCSTSSPRPARLPAPGAGRPSTRRFGPWICGSSWIPRRCAAMITLERRMSSSPATMRVARLHGVRDLRVESLPVPEPGPGELLVRIEGCGVCPTDVRKFLMGTGHDGYPLNPGHEWVGLVAAVGPGVSGWAPGDRTYGDTYAGYAEYATLTVEPRAWSHGPLRADSA